MKSDAERAVNLLLAGGSVPAIADQLGLEADEVLDMVSGELDRRTGLDSTTAAKADLARLDLLLMGIWKSASRGDSTAVTQALKITQQRAHLLDSLGGSAPDTPAGPSVADQLAVMKLDSPRPMPGGDDSS